MESRRITNLIPREPVKEPTKDLKMEDIEKLCNDFMKQLDEVKVTMDHKMDLWEADIHQRIDVVQQELQYYIDHNRPRVLEKQQS